MEYGQIIKIYSILILLILLALMILKIFQKYKVNWDKNILLNNKQQIKIEEIKIIDSKNKIVTLSTNKRQHIILISDNGNNLILEDNENSQ